MAQHSLKSGKISCGLGRGRLHSCGTRPLEPSPSCLTSMSLSILSNSAFGFVYVLRVSIRLRFVLFPPLLAASPSFLLRRAPPPPRSGAFGGARLPRLRLLLGDWARCEPLRADVSLGHVTTSPPVAVGSPVGPWRVICCHGLDRAPLNSYGGAPVPRPQTEAAVGDETFPG